MGWLETLRTGWDAVRSHRLRSALTMLGIIGIAGGRNGPASAVRSRR
jgi:hypothetical protein